MTELLHASAPVRLDFAGGWTDVPPFSAREGGVVVNAAIRLHAHATLEPGAHRRLVSEDLGEEAEVDSDAGLAPGGRLDLLKAAMRMLPPPTPGTLRTRCDAPPGSGLGSSGALDVALVAVLARARGEQPSRRQIAELGWRLETIEAGNAGGKQDQFAAAMGGFQRLTFRDPNVDCEPLALDPELVAELERRIVLCYTGTSRVSGATISRVIAGYERGDPAIVGAFRAMRDVADAMSDALRAADLARIGALLSANWREQQRLDPIMRTAEMERLERAMAEVGVLGGKAAGSGAGGCMFFVANDPDAAVEAARRAGAQLLPVAWACDGVTVE